MVAAGKGHGCNPRDAVAARNAETAKMRLQKALRRASRKAFLWPQSAASLVRPTQIVHGTGGTVGETEGVLLGALLCLFRSAILFWTLHTAQQMIHDQFFLFLTNPNDIGCKLASVFWACKITSQN